MSQESNLTTTTTTFLLLKKIQAQVVMLEWKPSSRMWNTIPKLAKSTKNLAAVDGELVQQQ